MDRSTSTVLASTGNLQALSVSGAASTTSASSTSKTIASTLGTSQNAASTPSHSSLSASSAAALANTTNPEGVFDLSSRIWQFVNFSGQLVQDMDSEVCALSSKSTVGKIIANCTDQDDLKLLRLRTKKHEFMIVPDPKYIFVVVHEVSS